jgi:aspartate/methionine/tyrosine aminotransferase
MKPASQRPRVPPLRERSIVLSGFSKTYCMTAGARLRGGAPALVQPLNRLVANSVTCSNTFVQLAAVVALRSAQDCVASMVQEFPPQGLPRWPAQLDAGHQLPHAARRLLRLP